MKELMNKVKDEFIRRLEEDGELSKEEVKNLYIEVERDIYLEYLTKVMNK